MQPTPLTGTATCGLSARPQRSLRMQPTPLTGTATSEVRVRGNQFNQRDAAHTPHGDGNV